MQFKYAIGGMFQRIFKGGIALVPLIISCNKLVQIPNPINSVTSNQVFSSNATASSAMLGIYSYMSSPNNSSFSNYQTTYYAGVSADELTDETPGYEAYDPFLINNITALASSSTVSTYFWQPAYYDIYCSNAIISGVQSSTGVTAATRNQLTGEAKFIRAFCYFYLTNLFGDIPLVLSADFNQTALLSKTSQGGAYQQIIADLQEAQNLMISDFSLSGGLPIRANKWAAMALLARVYLYEPQPNYSGADSAATAVINSGQFSLVPLPLVPADGVPSSDSDVFSANSSESILQLQTLNTFPYATLEGNFFIAFCPACGPNGAWLTSQLLGAFEPNDLRRVNWVDSAASNGSYYYYPYKYKVLTGSSGNITENYTLLRLAELYLIRAEAEANLNQLGLAINDLNTIRTRAGLSNLSSSLSQTQILAAIQQEYRIEFFAEWGHRWLDLKRWGIAIQTLDTISYKMGNIDSTQLLYPIPMTEIQTDPNLKQNSGY